MGILRNWFKRVRDAVENVFTTKDRHLEEAVRDVQEELYQALIRHAPDGSQNLDQFVGRRDQRPSARMNLIPIRESFIKNGGMTIASGTLSEALVSIGTVSKHTLYFTQGMPPEREGGTRPHRIPLRGFHFVKGVREYPMTFFYEGEDWWVWSAVNHKGIKLDKFGDFVAMAWEEVETGANQKFNDMGEDTIDDLMDQLRNL